MADRNIRGEFQRSAGARRITQELTESVETRPSRFIVWDTDLTGFGLRVTPTGLRSFILDYKTAGGVQRRQTIGRHPRVSAGLARQTARRILRSVVKGDDPLAERHSQRQMRKDRRTAPRVTDLSQLHLDTFGALVRAGKRSPTTLAEYRRIWSAYLTPALGTKLVSALTTTDIEVLHHQIKAAGGKTAQQDGRYQANRAMAVLRAALTLAVKHGWTASNPASGVELFQEEHRLRLLSPEEISKIGRALGELEAEGNVGPGAARAIRVLAVTGMRRDEVRLLKADQVVGKWIILGKTKSGTAARVPLTAPVERLLEGIGGWVCPSPRKRGEAISATGIQLAWKRTLVRAEVPHGPIHLLRHLVAGTAANAGNSEALIAELLHHGKATPRSVTARYIHLSPNAVQSAAEAVATQIDGWLQGEIGEPAQIVNFPGSRR